MVWGAPDVPARGRHQLLSIKEAGRGGGAKQAVQVLVPLYQMIVIRFMDEDVRESGQSTGNGRKKHDVSI